MPWSARAASGALVVLALALALAPLPALARAAGCIGLLAVAIAIPAIAIRRRDAGERGWITIDETGIVRVDRGGAARLARWSDAFGLSVFASRDRSRFLLAFTSPAQTRFVGVRADRGDLADAPRLTDIASTIAESEARGAHEDATLSAVDAERVIAEVSSRAPGALSRIYLSDPRGEPIVLDGQRLALGAMHVDLSAPLEWRGFMFHESGGRVTTFYQATWVRQAEGEAVLVATLPVDSGSAPDGSPGRDEKVQRAVARDLRLMHSAPEQPPPREHRLAVDGIFMLPLRQALDRAPRAAPRAPKPPSRQGLGEGQRTNT